MSDLMANLKKQFQQSQISLEIDDQREQNVNYGVLNAAVKSNKIMKTAFLLSTIFGNFSL